MDTHKLLSSPYQEAVFRQAVDHPFTTRQAIKNELNVGNTVADGISGAMVYKRILAAFPIYGNVQGFRVTRYACTVLNLDVYLSRRQRQEPQLFALGKLMDCSIRHVRPNTAQSLIKNYPELTEFADMATRLIPGDQIELVHLYVPQGGPERVPARINQIAGRYLRNAGSNPLVCRGQLGIRILCASVGAAEAASRRFARATQEPLCRLEIAVIHELQHLLVDGGKRHV